MPSAQKKARRGRPSTFDRRAALGTAMRLFWRHGYDGTSVAMLTDGMGVTPPTLYAAFGSKEELYRAALAHYVDEELGDRARVFADDISAHEMVERYLREAVRRFTRSHEPHGCMVLTASLQFAGESESAARATAELRALSHRAFLAKLTAAVRSGELPAKTDVKALARFFGAVLQGLSVQAIDGAPAEALDGIVELAMAAWPGRRPTRSRAGHRH